MLYSVVLQLPREGLENQALAPATALAQEETHSESIRPQKRVKLTDSQLVAVPLTLDRLLRENGFDASFFPNKSNHLNHQIADTKYACLARVAKLCVPMQSFTSAIRAQEGFLSKAVVFGIGPNGDNWANTLSHDLKKARDAFECSQERRSRFSCWTTFQSTAIAHARKFLEPIGDGSHPAQEASLINERSYLFSWVSCWVVVLCLVVYK